MYILILIYSLLFQPQYSLAASTPGSVSKFKRGERIQLWSRGSKAVVIAPRLNDPAAHNSADPTYFELVQQNNQLILSFRSKDPHLILSHQNPIVIELITDYPFSVEPSIITTGEWPKDSSQMQLKVAGATPGHFYRILGKATYSYCHMQTTVCTQALSTIIYSYRQ